MSGRRHLYGEDPDMGVNTEYCVVSSGSTFPPVTNTVVTPANSCAYTTLPTNTVVVTTMTEITTNNGYLTTLHSCGSIRDMYFRPQLHTSANDDDDDY
jgi:hypothetical protein